MTDERKDRTDRSARIARTMAAVGFVPKPALHPNHVEYAKMYADAEGRTARMTALISKGAAGIEEAQLESFVLTVQMHVPATTEAVEKAPVFIRADLYTILAALGATDEEPHREVVAIDCVTCGTHTPEFYVHQGDGKAYCPPCFKRAGTGADADANAEPT